VVTSASDGRNDMNVISPA